MIATGILKTYALVKNEKLCFAWNSHINKSRTLTTHINSKQTLKHIKPTHMESYKQVFKLPKAFHHFPMPLSYNLLP
jgi:hypothetical protein